MHCLFTGSLSYKINPRVYKFYGYHEFLFVWHCMGYQYHSTLWHLRWHRWMNTLPRHSNTWYRSVLCIIITLAYRLYSYWLLITIKKISTLYWQVIDLCFGQDWGLSWFSLDPGDNCKDINPIRPPALPSKCLTSFFNHLSIILTSAKLR
jgi:hypothetical protein